MSTKAELDLKSALISTGLVLPVESEGRGGHVSILCRQVPGQDRGWLQVVKEMLIAAEVGVAVDVHICRRYLVKSGQMVFGWHLGFEAKSQKEAQALVSRLTKVLEKAKPTLEQAEETVERAVRTQLPETARRGRRVADPDPEPLHVGPQQVRGVQVVEQGRDAKGKPWTVQEMPLPHVTRDLNAPTGPKSKGARSLGEDRDS